MLRKHGTGEILRDDEQRRTAARSDWTEEDQRELEDEIQDDDDDADEQD